MINLLASSILKERMVVSILYYSALIINFAGIAFALVYLILNIFTRISDMSERNAAMLKISKVSMGLAIGFAFLSCLLSDPAEIESALILTNQTFTIIAISWLVIIALCGLAMLVLLIIKKRFTAALTSIIKRIFVIALTGVIISLALTWLFS